MWSPCSRGLLFSLSKQLLHRSCNAVRKLFRFWFLVLGRVSNCYRSSKSIDSVGYFWHSYRKLNLSGKALPLTRFNQSINPYVGGWNELDGFSRTFSLITHFYCCCFLFLVPWSRFFPGVTTFIDCRCLILSIVYFSFPLSHFYTMLMFYLYVFSCNTTVVVYAMFSTFAWFCTSHNLIFIH